MKSFSSCLLRRAGAASQSLLRFGTFERLLHLGLAEREPGPGAHRVAVGLDEGHDVQRPLAVRRHVLLGHRQELHARLLGRGRVRPGQLLHLVRERERQRAGRAGTVAHRAQQQAAGGTRRTRRRRRRRRRLQHQRRRGRLLARVGGAAAAAAVPLHGAVKEAQRTDRVGVGDPKGGVLTLELAVDGRSWLTSASACSLDMVQL